MEELEIYIVRNCDGKYYPNKKFRGSNWATDIEDARILDKLRTARTVVTQVSNNHPNESVPVILRMIATVTEVMDETERVKEANEKKIKEEKAYQVRRAEWAVESAQRELERAKENMTTAQRRLNGEF